MTIHTKEFGQDVKEERARCSYRDHDYLCHGSDTFRWAWKLLKDDLRDIADDFLVDSPRWNTIVRLGDCWNSVLFIPLDPEDALLNEQRIGVRNDFIEWNLAKTTLQTL